MLSHAASVSSLHALERFPARSRRRRRIPRWSQRSAAFLAMPPPPDRLVRVPATHWRRSPAVAARHLAPGPTLLRQVHALTLAIPSRFQLPLRPTQKTS